MRPSHNILNAVLHGTVTQKPAVTAISDSDARPRVLVITTCSAGKRLRGAAMAEVLPMGDQRAVSDDWQRLLRREEQLLPARDLYSGRAFKFIRDSADRVNASFGVLSAGLGFVRGDRSIPGYDLTVKPGNSGSIIDRITGDFSPATWWQAVGRGPFASDLRQEAAGFDLVLVSLSKGYLALVAEDLLALEASVPGRLRLFGLSLGRHLPEALKPTFMPYDSRLDLVGRNGTRTDFSARALVDFLDRADLSASRLAHAEAVAVRMSTAGEIPTARTQRRTDDATISDEIRAFLASGNRGSRDTLAWLRRVRGLSCEQRRFSNLFRQIVMEATT